MGKREESTSEISGGSTECIGDGTTRAMSRVVIPRLPGRSCHRAGAWAIVLSAIACSGDASRSGDSAGEDPASRPLIAVSAVQLASFADRSAAESLAESLATSGWLTSLRPATVDGREVWRVQIAPTENDELTQRIAIALRGAGHTPLVVRDSARQIVAADVFSVNRGTHGMSARTKWMLSDDRSSLIVVEDPVAVEAEALPNGFIFATERGPLLIQQDSVWDVTPSPDWGRLAYSRGYILSAGESEIIPEPMWRRLAAEVRLPVDSVRRSAFMSSGMVPAYGFAQPVILDVSSAATDTSISGRAMHRTLPIAGGWRLRWTPDGGELAIGASPERVQDDSPSPAWLRVDPETGAVLGPIAESMLAPLSWSAGPVIDISIQIDLGATRSLGIEGGTLESRNGWIRRNGRIIGPGLLLAATRTGTFIAALAPRHDAKQYEAPVEPVVYQVTGGSR
jgi:hypothetical protein